MPFEQSSQHCDFFSQLLHKILKSTHNFYARNNRDTERFGSSKKNIPLLLLSLLNTLLKTSRLSLVIKKDITQDTKNVIKQYCRGFSLLYSLVNDEYSRLLLVELAAFRIMGYRKVKLSLNNHYYWTQRKKASSLIRGRNTIPISFNNWTLRYFELSSVNYDIKLYSRPLNITTTFILQHYRYSQKKNPVEVKKGDHVIDAGGGWGDTALYFAYKAGSKGKVYTFEFEPENLNIMGKNLNLNPQLKSNIEIIRQPLWNTSDVELSFSGKGPASKIDNKSHNHQNEKLTSLCIDDFARRIPKIDFIKMDIEGAELMALTGAVKTIKKYKPTLAISLYHSVDDFERIPRFIESLGVNYKYYVDHFTIHSEETVLFAEAEQ
jgi:FkbM family methyltransferase